jgi:hypothetical protein
VAWRLSALVTGAAFTDHVTLRRTRLNRPNFDEIRNLSPHASAAERRQTDKALVRDVARIDTGSREVHDSHRRVENAGAPKSEVRCAGADPWSGNLSALLLRAVCNRSVQKRSGARCRTR